MNVIETKRLVLEPLEQRRRDEFIALTADPETMRYWHPHGAYSADVAGRHFAASLANLEERGFGKRSVVSKETGRWIGFVDTTYVGPGCGDVPATDVEIGWMLTPSAWGHGYATEAGRAIRDEAFGEIGLDNIIAMHHPDNVASGRIIEKLGMVFEQDVRGWGGWPLRVYRLTRERWRSLP
jgi:RimJ/RimL family protein N-acetyltransferase